MSSLLDRDLLRLHWQKNRALRALPCVLPIACCLAAGIRYGNPQAGMVAASGAFSVGFGAFQMLGTSRAATMLGATLGMAVSALGGSLVGHRGSPGTILNAAWAGFGGGMLLSLGPGASWVGQKWAIVAIVASGYPTGTFGEAFARSGMILAGGALQTLFMLAVWRLRFPAGELDHDPFQGFLPGVRTLWDNLTMRSEFFRYALRLGLTLGLAAELARWWRLPNGYWVPMTALLVLKPDFQQTFRRGVERVLGTFAGAALASLLVHALRLDHVTMGALIVFFAWLGYTLINVNYAVYAVFLTAYIVFLLDFGGLTPALVVTHRTLNTALGGGVALLAYATVLLARKAKKEAPGTNNPKPQATAGSSM